MKIKISQIKKEKKFALRKEKIIVYLFLKRNTAFFRSYHLSPWRIKKKFLLEAESPLKRNFLYEGLLSKDPQNKNRNIIEKHIEKILIDSLKLAKEH